MEKFHLVGIKGTGMTSLASILQDLGYYVTGSDYEEDYFTSKVLKERKIKVLLFDKNNIVDNTTYISSSCYLEDNEEIKEILDKNYPLFYYHDFLEYFFKGIRIGVSGSHGKTTTTTFLANFFPSATYLIGDGTGSGIKDYKYFIYEACEYKNHFLSYSNDYLIINNIDLDHPDFFKTIEDVVSSFQKAANKSKSIIVNGDDENCLKIKHSNVTTFGLKDHNDIRARILQKYNYGYDLEIYINGQEKIYTYYLPFPGLYMIYNFLAAFTTCFLNGLDLDLIQSKLLTFKNAKRRMEEISYYDNVLIDDYAHHPTEIKALIKAVRQKYPTKKVVVLFQPHTYSRTILLAEDFKNTFIDVDEFYIDHTFTSKRENFNDELEKKVLDIFNNGKKFTNNTTEYLKKYRNSVIIFLGAGNINKYIQQFFS